MKYRKSLVKTVLLLLGLLSILYLMGCSANQSKEENKNSDPSSQEEKEATKEPVVLNVVLAWPVQDTKTSNAGFFMLKEKVERESNGLIVLNVLGGPEVVPPFELGDATRNGIVDLAWLSTAYYVPQMPEVAALAYSKLNHKQERETGAWDLINKIHQEKMGVYHLGRGGGAGLGFAFFTKNPVAKIEDFKGLQIRSSPMYVPFVEALGAEAITLPGGDIYSALERGVIDGLAWPEAGIGDMSLQEVVKYKAAPSFWQLDISAIVNLAKWNSLPEYAKEILQKSIIEVEDEAAEHFKKFKKEDWEFLSSTGMKEVQIENPDKFFEIADKAAWDWILKSSPKYGEQLKQMFYK